MTRSLYARRLASSLIPMSEPQTLVQALATLPEEERIILTMYYLKSMPVADIAKLLKVPDKSVETIIKMGKARLSALIGL